MTPLNPFDPSELDRADAGLDEVAAELEAYAADEAPGGAPVGLVEQIQSRIAAEPPPRRSWLSIGGWPSRRPFATALAAAAAVVLAVGGAVAFAELVGWVRQADVGASPTPTITAPPATPSPTPTTSSSPSPTPMPTTPSPSPSASEDDDEVETPEPSESEDDDDDNSGPGGGGNSGPGGGGNSGPGGGD